MPSNCFTNSNGYSSGNITTNGMSNGSTRHWPQDVGIVNMEFYSPSEYIEQSELESHDGVSAGKYLVGLGQTRMAICSENEDINSLCLTVTKRLIEKSNLSLQEIGFLMVGTETLLDKSKSIKTTLMQLFEGSGNHDVQGVDTTNACFGGTASLHHAVDWIESSNWDGRYAIVVCGDIAVYAEGPARPTGGAGAVAMLIGPNAPLIIERGVRSHYVKDTYDFYKPDFTSEYPVVDGKLSISCYMEAVYNCYTTYKKKYASVIANSGDNSLKLNDFDGLIFHAPYCKIVQKALSRLVFHEFKHEANPDFQGKYKGLEKYWKSTLDETMFDRDFESAFVKASSQLYDEKIKPSLLLATEVGNMYTASVYSCLVSFLSSRPAQDLAGKRVLIFSYGSGLAASMFSIRMTQVCDESSSLQKIQSAAQTAVAKLAERIKLTPAEFVKRLKEREESYSKAPFTPKADLHVLTPGTYYLTCVDKEHRRSYSRKPLATDAKQLPVKTPVIESLSLKD